jgi:hypothetical protein
MTNDGLPLLTQQQAARLAGVATRTFRDWGLAPASRELGRPRYSIERVIAEKSRREVVDNNSARSRRGGLQKLHKLHCGGNVFRSMLETYHDVAMQALGNAWGAWYADGDWRQTAGLTDALARDVAWRAYGYSVMCLSTFLCGGMYERLLKEHEGHDLDGFMQLFFKIDRRTAWTDPAGVVEFPQRIKELMPPDVLARLDAAAVITA